MEYGQRDTRGDEAIFYFIIVANPVIVTVVAFVDPFPGLAPTTVAAIGLFGSFALLGLWLKLPPVIEVLELGHDGVILAVPRSSIHRVMRVTYSRLPAMLSRGLFRAHAVWGRVPTNASGGLLVYLAVAGTSGGNRPRTIAVAFLTAADATAFGAAAAKLIREGEGPYRT